MIVTLLPFFLAANVAVNEIDWQYGPEVIYNGQVNSTANSTDTGTEIHMYNLTIKLKCRPKSDVIMTCHFSDSKSVVTVVDTNENVLEKTKTGAITERQFSTEIFELMFNRSGIQAIGVSTSISPVMLDMMRSFVLQLNVGADLTVQSMQSFDVMESSSAGECRTSYVVEVNGDNENYANDDKKNPYEIVVLPGDIGEIQKNRDIDDCPYEVDYFFGSREAHQKNINYDITLLSSMSRMDITRNGFASFTENDLRLKHNKLRTDIDLHERVSVTLDKIVPATGPLPSIDDRFIASVIPTRWLLSDSSEEFEPDSKEFERQFTS